MKEARYKYRLTKWRNRKELINAIQQIEAYEGKKKGYYLRKKAGKWAVYTTGDMVVKRKSDFPYKYKPSGGVL